MIKVQIHDVLRKVTEIDIDPRSYLELVLALLPEERREEFLEGVSFTMSFPMTSVWEFVQSLPDDKQKEVWKALSPLMPHQIVLLKEDTGDRILPIWIGPSETEAIVLKLKESPLKRPITHDLLATLLDLGHIQVEQVAISRLHEGVFYGMLIVRLGQNGETAEVDCRPSDALSLAVRLDAPIYIAPEVMNEEGIAPDENGRYQYKAFALPSADWRSLVRQSGDL